MTNYIYKKVKSIIFGLFSPEDIKKMSAAKVVTPELYDKEGYPVDGGLMDIRLGVIDPGLRCKTCGGKLKECSGHFGHIELARPVIHIKYIKPILDILKATCRECGRILADDKNIEKQKELMNLSIKKADLEGRKRKAKALITSLKNLKKCPHCSAKQFTIKIEKPTTFLEKDKRISPIKIRAMLEKVPNEDLELLGFNPEIFKPEWTILTNLPIPPVTMRPSITLETGERSEDDLTHKLGDIVRINQRLFENLNAGAPEIIIEDLWDLLQYHITTYIDNTVTQVPPARHRSGQPLKTISERIKSKEGRFRRNLVGKRVNFAARTVISSDPNLKFNEVGIPMESALELTIPERVNEWNIERLKQFVKNGPKNYPGANYVILPDGRKKKITDDTQEALLEAVENGYIVERHLINGDISIFNRQPSLHKMSIMAHRVKILPGRAFRMNPGICAPYNADFDGDEMNLHIPQTEESRSEAEILMSVQTQIISPKHGVNVIGCVEDSVSGLYLLTKEMMFSKEEAINILVGIGIDDYSRMAKFKSTVTGKELFSLLLPKDFSFIAPSKHIGEDKLCRRDKCKHDSIIIERGELTCGIINDQLVGKNNGLLIRSLHRQYKEDKTIEILGKLFMLGIDILFRRGFTTGIGDIDLKQETINEIKDLLKDSDKNVDKLIDTYNKGEMEALPGKNIEETLELNILKILNNTRNNIGELLSSKGKENNPLIIMSSSGAGGSKLNIVQMAACVGQQALRGRRIQIGYANRTLPLFKKNDLTPKARGFVDKGYKSGLEPAEFFFHAMTGRDALMDTALRTPKSGYLYRRLANALQDLKVEYDFTVRDANKTIIQFQYGEDNMDVSKSEAGTINVARVIKEITEAKK